MYIFIPLTVQKNITQCFVTNKLPVSKGTTKILSDLLIPFSFPQYQS